MILSLIVAYARNRQAQYVIGKDNAIPWHDSKDLSRFKEHTMGHAVIMGRKTFESIGTPLRGRDNIILTRQEGYEVPGAQVFNDLSAALSFAATKHMEAFIIGGQELYEQVLNKVDRMYITYIYDLDVVGDTYFPKWTRAYFKQIQEEKQDGRLVFEVLQRTSKGKAVLTDEEAIDFENPQNIPYYYAGFMI